MLYYQWYTMIFESDHKNWNEATVMCGSKESLGRNILPNIWVQLLTIGLITSKTVKNNPKSGHPSTVTTIVDYQSRKHKKIL